MKNYKIEDIKYFFDEARKKLMREFTKVMIIGIHTKMIEEIFQIGLEM